MSEIIPTAAVVSAAIPQTVPVAFTFYFIRSVRNCLFVEFVARLFVARGFWVVVARAWRTEGKAIVVFGRN